MPRVFTSANDPYDFCIKCFPSEAEAQQEYGNLGNGPDGRGDCFGWKAEHPPYEDSTYACAGCGEYLTQDDN